MKESIRKWLTEQFGDDAAIIADVYAEYISSTGAKMAELEETFARRDWEAIDHVAHTLKGNALMTGDTELADAAIALRQTAKAHDVAASEPLVRRLGELMRALKEEAQAGG